jgi:hypothetical protein
MQIGNQIYPRHSNPKSRFRAERAGFGEISDQLDGGGMPTTRESVVAKASADGAVRLPPGFISGLCGVSVRIETIGRIIAR